MSKRKNTCSLAEIEKKLYMGQPPQKMFVYTIQPRQTRAFVDRTVSVQKGNDAEVEYFCKVLEGCGF